MTMMEIQILTLFIIAVIALCRLPISPLTASNQFILLDHGDKCKWWKDAEAVERNQVEEI